MGEDGLARPYHVRRVGGIADHLQSEITFDAGAHVEGAFVHQRPAAMGALDAAQVIGDLGLQHGVDRLAEIMAQQHIFRRDGAIGFKLEHKVSVRLGVAKQRPGRRGDARLQRVRIGCHAVTFQLHFTRHP